MGQPITYDDLDLFSTLRLRQKDFIYGLCIGTSIIIYCYCKIYL